MKEYIEIVHAEREFLERVKKFDKFNEIAERILGLEKSVGVHYFSEVDLSKNIPNLPKDTEIRVGGALLEICVRNRVFWLKQNGYKNAVADKDISFSYKLPKN